MKNNKLDLIKVKVLQSLMPPIMMSVREWAQRYRVLTSENSSQAGRWNDDHAKYQQEIMESFTQDNVWKIVVVASAQTGKTEMELNMFGRMVCIDPGPALYVMPSQDFADDFSKRRIASMVAACPELKKRVGEAKSRDSSNTIGLKTYPGGSIAFIGANSPTQLAGRPIRYLFMDEVDRFTSTAGVEGDPVGLAEKRTETFKHNRKIVLTSTPTLKSNSKIMKEFILGTQEEWRTECPNCHQYRFIKFDQIKFDKDEYKDRAGDLRYHVRNVRWQCPNCLNELDEISTKRQPAKWEAGNPEAIQEGIRSFRLNAFMSPWSSWAEICTEFLDAKNDAEKLKMFVNTTLGEVWEERDNAGVIDKLYDRREIYDAEVPDGVLVLTMGVDTQDNRLEYEVVGWNRDGESWGINRGVIPGKPDTRQVWEEIDMLLNREWQLKDGRGIRISATFCDSGGHYTDDVYRECNKRVGKKMFAIKGEPGESKAYVRLMKRSEGGGATRFMVGVDAGKAAILYEAANVNEPGPNFMHFPRDYECGYDMEFFQGLISEKMVLHRRNGMNVMAWEKVHTRNEPLDCRNYARAAYKFFNWDFKAVEEALYGSDEPQYITRDEVERNQRRKKQRMVSSGIRI